MPAALTGAQRLRDRMRHAAPQVFDILRNKIVSLDLAPGTVLSRTELQYSFGLSSTLIRDTLLRLQEESLVEIYPQSSTIVSRIDVTQAQEAQFLRRGVELEVVRTLAAKPDESSSYVSIRSSPTRGASPRRAISRASRPWTRSFTAP